MIHLALPKGHMQENVFKLLEEAGASLLDFTNSGVPVTANLTDNDLKALGLSALNRDLTIRIDGDDAITIGGSAVTPGDYFVNAGDAGASVALHVISITPT